KRPDLLIRALETVNRKVAGARVVFAGQYDIPYERTWSRHRELVERFQDQLVFLGPTADAQAMADFYAALDVLALPSDSDCFALVQAEAMLCGTPVVATDTPGGRMPVIQTGMGKVVPRGDARALGEALVEVAASPAKYRPPREHVRRCFDIRRTVDRYEEEL